VREAAPGNLTVSAAAMKINFTVIILAAVVSLFDPFKSPLTPVAAFNMAEKSLRHSTLCELPGDPSLILTTNVDLGEQKLAVMKLCSKAVADHTGKPESYVGASHRGLLE
jgi:hypothetical protein